jgi:uncharacterized protein (TIGR02246 family)
MKKTWSLLLFGLLIALMSCTPKKAVVNNDTLIDSLLASCSTVWSSGNAETIADYYADDAIIIFKDNTYSGRDSILSFCKQVASSVKNLKTFRGTYAIANDLITGTGMYTFDWVGADQKVYPNRGSSTLYWKKNADNKWKAILQVNVQANVVVK